MHASDGTVDLVLNLFTIVSCWTMTQAKAAVFCLSAAATSAERIPTNFRHEGYRGRDASVVGFRLRVSNHGRTLDAWSSLRVRHLYDIIESVDKTQSGRSAELSTEHQKRDI